MSDRMEPEDWKKLDKFLDDLDAFDRRKTTKKYKPNRKRKSAARLKVKR